MQKAVSLKRLHACTLPASNSHDITLLFKPVFNGVLRTSGFFLVVGATMPFFMGSLEKPLL
jgi:hypothetical protein